MGGYALGMTVAGPEIEVDARGLLCPLPVLRLRRRLLAAEAGQVVRLLATDPAAAIDVPHFCAATGHALLGAEPLPDGATAWRVRAAAPDG